MAKSTRKRKPDKVGKPRPVKPGNSLACRPCGQQAEAAEAGGKIRGAGCQPASHGLAQRRVALTKGPGIVWHGLCQCLRQVEFPTRFGVSAGTATSMIGRPGTVFQRDPSPDKFQKSTGRARGPASLSSPYLSAAIHPTACFSSTASITSSSRPRISSSRAWSLILSALGRSRRRRRPPGPGTCRSSPARPRGPARTASG